MQNARAPLLVLVLVALAGCEPASDDASPAAATAPEANAPKGPDPKHGEYGLKVQFVRGQLEKDPCNRKKAKELSDWLNKAGDFEGTVKHVAAFEEKCGVWHRLLWTAVYANEQAGKWEEAAKLDTRLIESDPLDADFWWWRGKAHGEAGKASFAEADFRQAMVDQRTSNGTIPFQLSKHVGKDKPCEAAFGIQRYLEEAKKVADWAATKRSEHYVAGGCGRLEGKGSHVVKMKRDAPLVEVTATVGDAKNEKMLLNDKAAYFTITKAVAEKAGFVADEEITPVYLYGKHVPAKVGTAKLVSLGKARAIDVPVAVVDEIPGGHAGVVGQSFLWRFRTEDKGTSYVLKSR